MNKRQLEVEKAKLSAEEQVLARLRRDYRQAAKRVSEQIRLKSCEIDVLLKDIDELDEVQLSILQSKIYQKQFQESLKQQIDNIIAELNNKNYESINSYLKNSYELGYTGTMYDIAGQGIPLVMPINQLAMVKAVQLSPKVSKRLYGEYVHQLSKHIRNEVSRGIATADSYANIARNISNASKIGFNKSMRIARTEGHRVQCTAAFDAQHKAMDAGADIVKQWDATLDGRTRPLHRELDGQIRELDEPFEAGGLEVMYPSAFGRASQDINCRCALLQRARWALDEEELQTLKERAEYYGLDKAENISDYMKKYINIPEIEGSLSLRNGDIYGIKTTNGGKIPKETKKMIDAAIHRVSKELGFDMSNIDEILFTDIGDDIARASINTLNLSMRLKLNAKIFSDERILEMLLAKTPDSISPKKGLDGYLKHEITHFKEYEYAIKQATVDGVTDVEKAIDFIKKGVFSKIIIKEACKDCGMIYNDSVIKHYISKYGMNSSSEAVAEAISSTNDNELCNAVKKFILKKWR